MKIRIIERKDGIFMYEYGNTMNAGTDHEMVHWERCETLLFKSEEEARKRALEMIKFMTAASMKRVVEEIEIG